MRDEAVLEAVGKTPLVRLARMEPEGDELWLKLEGANPTGSVKDRIAAAMLARAAKEGRLTPGVRVLEPTSGNTGIALAASARRVASR